MSIRQAMDVAREMSLEVSNFTSFLLDNHKKSPEEIKELLNSSSSAQKYIALTVILDMVGSGKDCRYFYPDVIKNVYNKDIVIREMSSTFIILYSDYEPELTLMLVNTLQRAMTDSSAVMRLQALRLASALRVESVAPIIAHLIREMVNDVSPIVRIACFQAIGKVYELDSSLGPDLFELLVQVLKLPKQLFGDFDVAGWGLATLVHYWPQRVDIWHQFFRAYVPHLPEFDWWCQSVIVKSLVQYCRLYISSPNDADCLLLVKSVEPLLETMETSVVIEAASAVLYLGGESKFSELQIVDRLLCLPETELLWSSILNICKTYPANFTNYRDQIIRSLSVQDSLKLRDFKLQTVIACQGPELKLRELQHLQFCAIAWQSNKQSVRQVLQTIYILSGAKTNVKFMKWLIDLAGDAKQGPILRAESLLTMRMLVQQQENSNESDKSGAILYTLAQLALNDQVLGPARATIIWLLGTYCHVSPQVATEVLRRSLRQFVDQEPIVRQQILELSAKLHTSFKNDSAKFDKRVPKMFEFALKLCKYDDVIDIRDRARMIDGLLMSNDDENKMATLLLQAYKPPPMVAENFDETAYIPNTSSAFVQKPLDGYIDLYPWRADNDTSHLRAVDLVSAEREPTEVPVLRRETYPKKEKLKNMSLQEFLAVSSGSEGSDSETDSASSASNTSDGSSDDASDSDSGTPNNSLR